MMDTGYHCVLEFDSDDPEFTRGFECVGLWWELRPHPLSFSRTLHASNREMAHRIAKRLGYRLLVDELADGWIEVTFKSLE